MSDTRDQPVTTTKTIGSIEISRAIGTTEKQVQRVTKSLVDDGLLAPTVTSHPHVWTVDQLRRLQVAAALSNAIPVTHPRLSAFPAAARAVFATDELPDPKFWAVYTSEGVSYVLYNADIGNVARGGAVVVEITELWPDGRTP